MKQSITYLKNINITPKKLRFYLKDLKKMDPSVALENLYYGRQKSAYVLYQAIKSAINNAKQMLNVNEDMLKFKLFTIEEGQKLKRYRPGGRGTPKPIIKRKSHIKIIIIAKENKPKLEVKKTADIKSEAVKK